MRVLVVNGPNLNLLGRREPDVYGSVTLAELDSMVASWAAGLGVETSITQSNSEAGIVELIQDFDGDGIVLNAGALTHTSRAIGDALRAVPVPAVEVHISNIRAREPWRAESLLSDVCVASIYGRGVTGYRDAIRHLVNRASMPFRTVTYGPHPDNVGDLRDGGEGRLVVLVHGGLWRQEYQRDTMESLAVDLAARGHVTWNIEYRRRGSGGGWPGSAHDVLTAFDHASRLTRSSEGVVVVGHSAGSQLGMWAAGRTSTPVSLHVALAPILDLAAAVRDDDPSAGDCTQLLAEGCPPEMSPDGIPTVIVHGDDDRVVPVGRSIDFAARHQLEHHRSDVGHFTLLDPTGTDWPWVVERIESTG